MTYLNAITVAEAIPIIGDEMGIDYSTDTGRAETLVWLNRIRSLWYHGFQKRKLFDDLTECVPLQTLCAPCLDCVPCPRYQGFSIPSNMTGPVSVWAATEPVTLRSRWFDKFAGRSSGNVSMFSSTPVNGSFPTESDILDGSRISITARSSRDDGKKMIIKGIDCCGKERAICCDLIGDGVIETEFELKAITSIVLPKLCGEVVVRSMIDERVLSIFNPSSPTVPNFRRFQVDSVSCAGVCAVYVQANRKYRDVFADDDIVEIGDRLVLEHGASYFRFGKNTTDTKELQRANLDRNEMLNLISGMVDREAGGHIQDGPIAIRGRRTSRASLPGYNR